MHDDSKKKADHINACEYFRIKQGLVHININFMHGNCFTEKGGLCWNAVCFLLA